MAINMHGNYLTGAGEPSRVAHVIPINTAW